MRTIALIDGDVVCYKACESRYQRNFDGHYIYTGEPQVFSEEENAKYLEVCWKHVKDIIDDMVCTCFADDYLMAVAGETNFRFDIYSDYKKARRSDTRQAKKNIFVPELRRRAVREGYAVEAVNRETDDMLRMWSYEVLHDGDQYVIVTVDKDLQCIPGIHYLMHKDQFLHIDVETATRFYYEQLLKGDPTDSIPGIEGCGPKTATKLLANCHSEAEMQQKVIECYKLVYEDKWLSYLLSNGKMIHLQRHPTDYFNITNWNNHG